ncbi:type VII secretion target [Rhodococcus sp. Q]|uniref:type VII secretion target n=1 Tax=Rhodococcus sp. Q TaxID=2502252 RepID=UPI0014857C18|nr:type VII secretion target [Rhodococcus sp. Q]
MGEPLDVDTDALRSLAASLTSEADRISGVDPSTAINAVTVAMQGSSIAASAARAGHQLLLSYRATAERVRDMASTAESNAREYDAADEAFRRNLDSLPGDV